MALSILVIDDEENIGWAFKKYLTEKGYDVQFTTDPEDGLLMLRYSPDIIFLDFKMPKVNGLEVLKRIRQQIPDQIVIMMTGYANVENAVEAMRLGAFHYIQKPFQIDDTLPWIDKAKEFIKLRQRIGLQDNDNFENDFGLLRGKSDPMLSIFKKAKKVASKPNTTVLIYGESGTGKELIAKSIHSLSSRKNCEFVPLNCASIPEELLESELFGYEPGAFTGATRRKKGKFEIADKGTIFLDEIADMSLKLQSKILRVLQDGLFSRLGTDDSDLISVDVRVIAATNKKLEDTIALDQFREDLYYRLNTYVLEMPPLREREDDILDLALYFVSFFKKEINPKVEGIHPEAAQAIKTYRWPGNVRQLKNAIEHAMIECESNLIHINNLPDYLFYSKSVSAKHVSDKFLSSGIPTLEEVKRAYIIQALGKFKTDQEAADALGINRRTITRFKKEISESMH